jgi:hypothetical protein
VLVQVAEHRRPLVFTVYSKTGEKSLGFHSLLSGLVLKTDRLLPGQPPQPLLPVEEAHHRGGRRHGHDRRCGGHRELRDGVNREKEVVVQL